MDGLGSGSYRARARARPMRADGPYVCEAWGTKYWQDLTVLLWTVACSMQGMAETCTCSWNLQPAAASERASEPVSPLARQYFAPSRRQPVPSHEASSCESCKTRVSAVATALSMAAGCWPD